jgi:segregation and condensation protein B
MTAVRHELRVLEAMLFAATQPVPEEELAGRLPEGTDLPALLDELKTEYAERGINLTRISGKWAFRTAEDLAPHLRFEAKVERKPSRAAIETLAIIAYHQPVTRSEIEEIRGVAIAKGTLDVLLEAGWIRPVGRRQTPGRPTTWGTSEAFLHHFGFDSLADLPGLDELKAAGLLDTRPASSIVRPPGTSVETEPPGPVDADDEAIEAPELSLVAE